MNNNHLIAINSLEFRCLHIEKSSDLLLRHPGSLDLFKISAYYILLEVAARYARLLLVPAGGMPASRAGGLRPPPPHSPSSSPPLHSMKKMKKWKIIEKNEKKNKILKKFNKMDFFENIEKI